MAKTLTTENGETVADRRVSCPHCGDGILDSLLEEHIEAVHGDDT